MNFGEIKSFLQGTSLFDVNQANGSQSPVANLKPNLGQLISGASIVERSESASLSFSVLNKVISGKLQELDPQAPPAKAKEAESAAQSGFDFEEIAKNVLSFVEKALNKAKNNGADDDKLAQMMSKARQGVEDGFGQAREELEGLGQLNEEIEDGIGKSFDAIQTGLDRIEEGLFGEGPQGPQGQLAAGMVAGAYEVNYSVERSSSLSITTNDGDKVSINFAEAMAYQRSESAAVFGAQDDEGNSVAGAAYSMSESRYQAAGFSFSVEGDLDDDEKAAIADLVKDVSKLADEFFNGDVEKAFAQAQNLGYDDSELSGFALNMSRVETVSVAAAYQQVAQYEGPGGKPPRGEGEQGQGGDHRPNLGQMFKPVANYMKELMDFIEQARERLDQGSDLESLVSDSVGKYLEYKGESDIPAALERFAEFNQRLLSGLNDEVAQEQAESGSDDATETPTS